ncbi:MAG: hypothetical protein ORN49_02685 [Rhodobacteraceae bacterium]|nr:hypothetical protein [Paracoccaceae bacterium]
MLKFKLLAAMAVLAAVAGCMPGNGRGVSANCALMGAAGGAALGAVSENDIATSALVGGVAGAAAGNAGLCN